MTKITTVVSTIHPGNWVAFCAGMARNSIEQKVIFIGPYGPEHSPGPLAVPVEFIHSAAKPAQCWEIGVRAVTSDLVCTSCDDWFYSDGFLDDVHELAKTSRNVLDTYTGRLLTNGVDCTPGQMMCGSKNMPLLSVAGVGFTEGHHKIGGIDRRFHATLWDTDLYTRMFVEGGRPTLLPGHISEERGYDSDMSKKWMPNDHPILLNLWAPLGRFQLARNGGVDSYSEAEAGPALRK